MNIRTDLAAEQLEQIGNFPAGTEYQRISVRGIPCVSVKIRTAEAAHSVGKPCGNYYTLETAPFLRTEENFPVQVEAAAELLRRLLPPEGLVLTVGLGNRAITPDALGPETVEQLLVTRHLNLSAAEKSGLSGLRPSAAIAPGVLGQTGMESAEIIAALVRLLRPAAVIAVDALAAGERARLGRTVQICDSGISPGSGVANSRKELSARTLGVPVIAAGVPTVMDFSDEKGGAPLMVTPREIDSIIGNAAKMLGFAINRALQPEFSLEDLLALIS